MNHESRLHTFQGLRKSVKTELKWGSAGPLRDAVALALLPLADKHPIDYGAIKEVSDHLKQSHNKLHFLRSSMRYVIAASLLTESIDPSQFTAALSDGRQTWKSLKLRRSSPYEGASLITLYFASNGSINHGALSTLKSAYDRLKEEHFWAVGPFTLPALTLALQFNSNADITAAEIFRELKNRKFPSQYRMSTALIASISGRSPLETADWLTVSYQALKRQKLSTAASRTTSLALGYLTEVDPEQYAISVSSIRQNLKEGMFSSSDAGSLALNFVNMCRVMDMQSLPAKKDLAGFTSVLSALQAYIAMQEQAAFMAAVVGGAVAATAAS